MQFKVNNGAVKMLELIDQSKSLVWKITFPEVTHGRVTTRQRLAYLNFAYRNYAGKIQE
jgi:hypothetical protein